jgi:hypothetical protein
MCLSWYMEGAETPATASSTLVENEQAGSRKLRSQAGAELGPQERSLFSAASADRAAGQLAAGEALYSCSPGDFQGCGVLAAAISQLVETLWRIERTTSCGRLDEDLEDLETQLRVVKAAAETCAPMRFMGAVVADFLVNIDVRNDWKRRERERVAATASKGAAWGAGDACIPPQVFPGLPVSPTPVPLHYIQPPLPSFYPSLSHPTSPHPTSPYPIPSCSTETVPFPSAQKQCSLPDAVVGGAAWQRAEGQTRWWWFISATAWNALMRALHGSGLGRARAACTVWVVGFARC